MGALGGTPAHRSLRAGPADFGQHLGAKDRQDQEQGCNMPSLIRFLVVVGVIGAAVIGGLYVLAVFFEPNQRETSTPLPGVKVRR
jgi:hypothetical protein